MIIYRPTSAYSYTPRYQTRRPQISLFDDLYDPFEDYYNFPLQRQQEQQRRRQTSLFDDFYNDFDRPNSIFDFDSFFERPRQPVYYERVPEYHRQRQQEPIRRSYIQPQEQETPRQQEKYQCQCKQATQKKQQRQKKEEKPKYDTFFEKMMKRMNEQEKQYQQRHEKQEEEVPKKLFKSQKYSEQAQKKQEQPPKKEKSKSDSEMQQKSQKIRDKNTVIIEDESSGEREEY